MKATQFVRTFAFYLIATATREASAEVQDGCAGASCGPRNRGSSMLQVAIQRRTADKPTVPALCTESNRGECECADSSNLQTFTYWDADGVQQCFTAYVPPTAKRPMPVTLYS